MYADIIKTCAAHGAMCSGAAGAHIGSMPRKVLFYISRAEFFSLETQPCIGSFRFPRKTLYVIDLILSLLYFFSVDLFVHVKKQKQTKISINFFPRSTQHENGRSRFPSN